MIIGTMRLVCRGGTFNIRFDELNNALSTSVTACSAERLQLNADKTDLLCIRSSIAAIADGPECHQAVSIVRYLCVLFDAQLSMARHVSHRRVQDVLFHMCCPHSIGC